MRFETLRDKTIKKTDFAGLTDEPSSINGADPSANKLGVR
jgi:hypothetical protein